MVKGESVLGDDIAYLRKREGKVFAVNVERGIFGIVKNVNSKDDPLIWKALTTPAEVIFSNLLIKDGVPYWQGDGRKKSNEGTSFFPHPNARYTIRLKSLKNCDPELENPKGVEIRGLIYGGRDSDTWPPVFESFNWLHGVITIAGSLESETTAATLGKKGVRKFNPMANLDFLSIPIGRYIKDYLDFEKGLDEPPIIFGVNYFLKDKDGNYITGMHDKRVWLKWMELRVHNDVKGIKTPIGIFPKYEDLKELFKEVLNKDYSKEDYINAFTLRIPENLKKVERIIQIYKREVHDSPEIVFETIEEQKERLKEAEAKPYTAYLRPLCEKYGKTNITLNQPS